MKLEEFKEDRSAIIAETESDIDIIRCGLGAAHAPHRLGLALGFITLPGPLDMDTSEFALRGIASVSLGDYNFSECGYAGLQQEQANDIISALYSQSAQYKRELVRQFGKN